MKRSGLVACALSLSLFGAGYTAISMESKEAPAQDCREAPCCVGPEAQKAAPSKGSVASIENDRPRVIIQKRDCPRQAKKS